MYIKTLFYKIFVYIFKKSTTRSDNLPNRPFFQVSTQIAVTGKLRLQIK